MNRYRVYFVTLDPPNHLDIDAPDITGAKRFLRQRIMFSMGKKVSDEQVDLLIEQIVNLTEEEQSYV